MIIADKCHAEGQEVYGCYPNHYAKHFVFLALQSLICASIRTIVAHFDLVCRHEKQVVG